MYLPFARGSLARSDDDPRVRRLAAATVGREGNWLPKAPSSNTTLPIACMCPFVVNSCNRKAAGAQSIAGRKQSCPATVAATSSPRATDRRWIGIDGTPPCIREKQEHGQYPFLARSINPARCGVVLRGLVVVGAS